MLHRGLLVKLMLAALGVTAVSGIAAVLSPSPRMAGRLALTAATVVVACGLLLPAAGSVGDGRSTALQRVWSGWVLSLTALLLLLQWLGWNSVQSMHLDILTAAWAGYGVPAMLVAIPALRHRARSEDRSFALAEWMAIVTATVTFLGGVCLQVGADMGVFPMRDDRVPLVAFNLLAGGGLMSLGALAVRRSPGARKVSPQDRWIGALGMAAAAVATVISLPLAIDGFDPLGLSGPLQQRPSMGVLMGLNVLSGLAVAAALWSTLHPMGLQRWAAWLPVLMAGLALLMTAIRAVSLVEAVGDAEWLGRLGMAAAIAEACALMVTAVVLRMRRSMPDMLAQIEPVTSLPLPCPRCQNLMRARSGENACGVCGLVVLLGFRDDRCPVCHYDLRGAVEPACPECGRTRQMPAGTT
jgi:hypothetical protein